MHGGFASNPELARKAGAKGGKISKRGKKKDAVTDSGLSGLSKATYELCSMKKA